MAAGRLRRSCDGECERTARVVGRRLLRAEAVRDKGLLGLRKGARRQ